MEAGQRNFTIIDTEFIDSGRNGFIYFEMKNKPMYNLTGTVDNFLVESSTFIANKNALIWASHNYHPTPQKDIMFRNNYVELRGGESIVHVDTHPHDDSLRTNFTFDGNTKVENGGKLQRFAYDVKRGDRPATKPIWKENNNFQIPNYFESGGATQYVIYQAVSGPQSLVVHEPYMKIHDLPANSTVELEMNSQKHRYPEGFQSTLIRTSNRGIAVLKRNSNWNDFPEDIYRNNGDSLKIKKQDSIFRLTEWNGKKVLSFRDQDFSFATAKPEDTASVYGHFTGVADGQIVTVHINTEGVTLEHNDKLILSNNQPILSSGTPMEVKFIRDGDALIEIERLACQRSLVSLD